MHVYYCKSCTACILREAVQAGGGGALEQCMYTTVSFVLRVYYGKRSKRVEGGALEQCM